MADQARRAIDYSTMQYAMFLVMREIRGKTAPEVADLLSKRLQSDTETFASTDRFRLNAMNGRQIHRLLARLTDYVETSSGMASRFAEYIQRNGKNGYEIEHHLGPIIQNGMRTNSTSKRIFRNTETGSGDSCYCPRASMRVTETCPTPKNASTT